MAHLFPFSLDWKNVLPAFLQRPPSVDGDPTALSCVLRVRGGVGGMPITLRAAQACDAEAIQQLVRGLSMESRYRRFFNPLRELPPDLLARFTMNDPAEAITLLATVRRDSHEVVIAMAQYATDPYPLRAEFGVVVADDWQRAGLGTRLIRMLSCIATTAGIMQLEGAVLADNEPMVRLMVNMGFVLDTHEDGAYLWKAWKMLETPPRAHADWRLALRSCGQDASAHAA